MSGIIMSGIIIFLLMSAVSCLTWSCVGLYRNLVKFEREYSDYRNAVNAKIDRLMSELKAAETAAIHQVNYDLES